MAAGAGYRRLPIRPTHVAIACGNTRRFYYFCQYREGDLTLLLRKILLTLYCLCAALASACFATPSAFADSCDNLDRNKTWHATFDKMNNAFINGDYDAALQYSRTLEEICDQSPALNYVIAHIYKKQGNREKYLFYLQKSTMNTERFLVDRDLLDRIWRDKYIAEHPEADPENIQKLETTMASLAEDNARLTDQLKSVQLTTGETVALQEEINQAHRADDAMLWTSIAIAGTGLVLTAAGSALVIMHKDKAIAYKNDGSPEVYVTSQYPMAWGLVGAGIATTLLGTALSGYFGYKYHKNHKDNQTKTWSFSLTPTYSSMTFTF